MGLLSVLRKARANDREARILLVGLDAAGKSTVVAALEAAAAAEADAAAAARNAGDAGPASAPHAPAPGDALPAQVAPTLGFEIRTLQLGG